MRLSVTIAPLAHRDVAQTCDYLTDESPDLARAFVSALAASIRGLREFPMRGRMWADPAPEFRGLRSVRLVRFSAWLVFYRVGDSGIRIERVLHGSRDLRAELERTR